MKQATSNVENVEDLIASLVSIHNGLLNKTINPKDVYEINNGAKNIISATRAQLAYQNSRREFPEIPFLDQK